MVSGSGATWPGGHCVRRAYGGNTSPIVGDTAPAVRLKRRWPAVCCRRNRRFVAERLASRCNGAPALAVGEQFGISGARLRAVALG
jgi:hypothetical protein